MSHSARSGAEIVEEIKSVHCLTPHLWWLGQAGFVLKFKNAIVLIDPSLPTADGTAPALLEPAQIDFAGLILCTRVDPPHFDAKTVLAILDSSRKAKVVVPRRVSDSVIQAGVPLDRMVTTDANLRVEYLDDRIYAVPSTHKASEGLPSGRGPVASQPLGGFPALGYLVRFGPWTIFHAGECSPYPGLGDRLRPYNVSVAILPVSGRQKFEPAEAADLAQETGARWLIPATLGSSEESEIKYDSFVQHILGHRPNIRFKAFQPGEMWAVPE